MTIRSRRTSGATSATWLNRRSARRGCWKTKRVVESGASSAKTPTCSFTAAAKFNGYQYYCIVTDGSGNTVQSNTVTLTVN